MVITQISEPRRQPNRRRIHLDGVFAFTCNLNVVARFRLRDGMTLSEEQVLAIQRGEVRQECFDQAMRYLKLHLQSRSELFKKLMRREYGRPIVESVLDQLTEQGYVDDEKFARVRAISASQHKRHGRMRTRIELLKKGLRGELVDRVLAEVYKPADSVAMVRLLVEKQIPRLRRLGPAIARRRLIGMLQRRGFEYEMVRPIVDDVLGSKVEVEPDSGDERFDD